MEWIVFLTGSWLTEQYKLRERNKYFQMQWSGEAPQNTCISPAPWMRSLTRIGIDGQENRRGSTSQLIQWCQCYPYTEARGRHYEKRKLPVFLVNVYIQILNKILVNWIQQHMEGIIQPNPVGFMPRMPGWYCIWKIRLISIIHLINKRQNPHDHQKTWKHFYKIQYHP